VHLISTGTADTVHAASSNHAYPHLSSSSIICLCLLTLCRPRSARHTPFFLYVWDIVMMPRGPEGSKCRNHQQRCFCHPRAHGAATHHYCRHDQRYSTMTLYLSWLLTVCARPVAPLPVSLGVSMVCREPEGCGRRTCCWQPRATGAVRYHSFRHQEPSGMGRRSGGASGQAPARLQAV
jgi:hypothetical protein